MPRKTERAVQAAQALKSAKREKHSSRVFDGFSVEYEWRMLTTSEKRSRQRTILEVIELIVRKTVKH